jgi:uncharacterized protein with HEPN domain
LKKEFLDYIHDIIDAINNMETFVQNMDYEHFASDTKTSFAVVRAIQIIGEAAKNVPSEVRVQYPEIPWKLMAGMRDKLVHEYWGIDLETVWKTLKEDIPPIKPLLENIIKHSPLET